MTSNLLTFEIEVQDRCQNWHEATATVKIEAHTTEDDIEAKITQDAEIYCKRHGLEYTTWDYMEEWPIEIYWQDPYTGELSKFYRSGVGLYPYDCIAKDKYPDAVIYRDNPDGAAGSWLHSEGLKQIRPGVYRSVYRSV